MRRTRSGGVPGGLGAMMLALALLCGCESDSYERHTPPAGQGALVVDNHTADEVSIFLDGAAAGTAGSDRYRVFDRTPGTYRLVIADRDDGRQSFRGYIEVLEGWLTIVDVWSGSDIYSYDVRVRYTEPR